MNQDIVQRELKKLESNEKAVILHNFLEDQGEGENNDLSEMLLDVIHSAFASGFEIAIDSLISSFKGKAIE